MAVLLHLLHLSRLSSSGYTSPLENPQESLIYLILPAIGFRQAADTTRLTRSSMLDEMNKEYVDTARSLGFRERKVVYKFTLRNAMIPTLTISGLQLAGLLGGTVIHKAILLGLASAASFTKRSSSETIRCSNPVFWCSASLSC